MEFFGALGRRGQLCSTMTQKGPTQHKGNRFESMFVGAVPRPTLEPRRGCSQGAMFLGRNMGRSRAKAGMKPNAWEVTSLTRCPFREENLWA